MAASLLMLLTTDGQGISIQYGTVPRPEIERRLNAAEQNNAKREQKLRELFAESGCSGEYLAEKPVKHVRVPNVVCTLAGTTDSVIVVGGHFDLVDAGKGVVDNWSGCSMLPSLYLSLKGILRRHTFVFIGFTNEEKGLVGSRFYVDKMSKDEIKKTSAMINLDSLGTSPTKLESDRGDKKLANALALVARTFKMPLSVVNVHLVGRSDSDSFQDRHVPTLNIHSLTNETFPILHTRRDRMEAIQLDDYYDSYRLMSIYLAYLDQLLDPGTE